MYVWATSSKVLVMHRRIPAKLLWVRPDLVSPSTSSSTSHDIFSTAETVGISSSSFVVVLVISLALITAVSPSLPPSPHFYSRNTVLLLVLCCKPCHPASYTKDLRSHQQVYNECHLPVLTGTVMLFSYFVFLASILDILAVNHQKLC